MVCSIILMSMTVTVFATLMVYPLLWPSGEGPVGTLRGGKLAFLHCLFAALMLGLSTECIQMVCSIIFMSMAAAVLLALGARGDA